MRKWLLMIAAAATLAVPSAVAFADQPPAPPGQGECEHGNSGQECKPDPQPEHGQDCEEHGPFEGGVNEDHCLLTTTTTVTTTSAPPVTTVTTTSTPVESVSTTTTAAESTTSTTTTVAPTSTTTTTTSPTQPVPTNTGSKKPPAGTTRKVTQPSTKGLAFTGFEDVVPLGFGALGLFTLGSGLLYAGRRKR